MSRLLTIGVCSQINGRELYTRKAVADGGVVESPTCVKLSFDTFKGIPLTYYTETQEYITAAEAAGGTVVSFSCIRNSFTELKNISL